MDNITNQKKQRIKTQSYDKIPDISIKNNLLNEYGIILNTETAKKAVVLSEIINSPASKRRRRR